MAFDNWISSIINVFRVNYYKYVCDRCLSWENERIIYFVQGVTSTSTNTRRQSEAAAKETTPEPDFESSGPEDDELDEEQKAARMKRRLIREVKFLKGKLERLKDKQQAAQKERQAIRESMKKNQVVLQ